jgi:hypothetical protein
MFNDYEYGGPEHQLQVACGNPYGRHLTCDAASNILNIYPTTWNVFISMLNDPNETDENKEVVFKQMSHDGQEYRRLHFNEFEELEKNMFLELKKQLSKNWVVEK